MSKARQCIIKAAALRAQADKLEKVAVLVDQGADSGSGSTSTAAKVGIGLGAGALGLATGGALGLAKGRELGLTKGRELGLAKGRELGLAEGSELATKQLYLQRAKDLKAGRDAIISGAITSGGFAGIGSLLAGDNPVVAGLRALHGGVQGAVGGHNRASLWNNIQDYLRLKKLGLW